ncbi:DNA polymerase III, chi subunit [Palleronia salina]|uniref:DNA polymerase III, chi subunit n=2 Tax=Palleronia TaxID=315422 RepID=A0A1M6HW01_9RHOB|nr:MULTISPECIES: DNA polymerase III subunit chi [Palleronia]SEM76421.1 DNA polymerase III, chi subunit [Palleronia pelagia]SHJ26379.1 DNA polymerase III, chi subunit [Palleronia salina]
MGVAMFYHLTRRPLEAVLPTLLEKSLAQGWRVCVRGGNAVRLDQLDQALWTYSDDSFLPHGRAGGPHDALQPVLLADGPDLPPRTACLMSVDGANVSLDEVNSLERVCILFDGNDNGALEKARSQWRDLTRAGASAQYWSEESGQWQKKAES